MHGRLRISFIYLGFPPVRLSRAFGSPTVAFAAAASLGSSSAGASSADSKFMVVGGRKAPAPATMGESDKQNAIVHWETVNIIWLCAQRLVADGKLNRAWRWTDCMHERKDDDRETVALPGAGAGAGGGAMARPPRPCRPLPFFSLRYWLSRLHVAAKLVLSLAGAGAAARPAMAAAPFSSPLLPARPVCPLHPQLAPRSQGGTPPTPSRSSSFVPASSAYLPVYHQRDREPPTSPRVLFLPSSQMAFNSACQEGNGQVGRRAVGVVGHGTARANWSGLGVRAEARVA